MAQRRSLRTDECPVARTLDVVGDQWSLLIIRDAFDGVRRFKAFHDSLGIARNILADRLRALVSEEILRLEPASDGSLYQEYVLTPKGESLFPVIVCLRQWGERHMFSKGEAHSRLVERATGRAVGRVDPLTRDGRPLAPSEAVVRKLSSGKLPSKLPSRKPAAGQRAARASRP